MGPVIVDVFGQINLKQSHWMIIAGFILQNAMLYFLYWSPTALLFYSCIALRGVGGCKQRIILSKFGNLN